MNRTELIHRGRRLEWLHLGLRCDFVATATIWLRSHIFGCAGNHHEV
jgi:hypothetical protein